jgi:hypothetical protein
MRRQYKQQAQARKQARQSKELLIGGGALILAAVFLIAAFMVWNNNRGTTGTAIAYQANEVAREGAFTAVHAMEPGPDIPFLPADDPQPRIVISETNHNFGSVGPRDVMRRTVAIRNDGDAPLTISHAYTTCGCTTAEFSASVIPPGMVAEVTIIFDAGAHDSRGQTVRRGVIIESNDPRRSQTEIWVQASVRTN